MKGWFHKKKVGWPTTHTQALKSTKETAKKGVKKKKSEQDEEGREKQTSSST
jgi:hypothetical protein